MGRRRVHILGASGCGVSTLGRAVSRVKGWPYYDTDDFYWQPTDPPFRVKRPPSERLEHLLDVASPSGAWVIGGALDGWGDPLIERFELVVFLDAPTAVRLLRLRERERRRFGERIAADGDMHEHHAKFLAWAASYDDPAPTHDGRSRAKHEAWLSGISTAVIRVDANRGVERMVDDVLRAMALR